MVPSNDMKLEEMRSALADICRSHFSEDEATLLMGLARPAVRLQHTDSVTKSHLGGTAQMGTTTAWPANAHGEPLSLLCVPDLAELEPFETDLALPSTGILNVFYDYEEQPWGFHPSDRSGWRVIWADAADSVACTSDEWEATQAFISVEREKQWSMLLQIDTDDEADWMWGDVGTLYFTVQRPFNPAALPESAWMAVQCG